MPALMELEAPRSSESSLLSHLQYLMFLQAQDLLSYTAGPLIQAHS